MASGEKAQCLTIQYLAAGQKLYTTAPVTKDQAEPADISLDEVNEGGARVTAVA